MSDYILGLREVVGHRPLLQVGASVILMNRENEILLQRRSDNGMWAYHGGSVELDENVEDAARRELFEETGLTAGKMTLLGVFSGADMHYVYPNGDEVSNVDVVFVCREYTGEMRMQESEVTQLCFFPLNRLPEEISPPNRKALAAFLDTQKQATDNRHE